MKILILEDNELQKKQLRDIIKGIDPNCEILEAGSTNMGFILCEDHIIDIFFIDIQLKDGSGLEFAKKLREDKRYKFSHFIFVSSHRVFALEAFKSIHCYDFIYKPYQAKEIGDVLNKLKDSPLVKNEEEPSVRFNLKDIYLRIYLDDIYFAESQGKDTTIHTRQGKHIIKRTPLKQIFSMLNSASKEPNFRQCHRSYVVNINHVSKILLRNGVYEIHFYNYNAVSYVGHLYKKQLSSFIKESTN